MKKIFLIFAASIFFIPLSYAIQETEGSENEPKVYMLNQCLKIAAENSPILKKAKYNLEISKQDTKIAKSNFFPVLGIGANYYQYINSDKRYDDGYSKRLLPDVSIYLQQLIFDFGKTNANIDMRKFYKIAAEYEYNNVLNETINSVQTAYFNVLEAQAAVAIEENNLYISEKIAADTDYMVRLKKKSKIDYIDSKVNLINAQMKLTDAKNNYNSALIDLYNKMYVDDKSNFKIKNINEFYYMDAYFAPDFLKTDNGKLVYKKTDDIPSGKEVIYDTNLTKLPFTLEQAYEMAYMDNPKLKALENTYKAMEKYTLTKKREYYPSLKYKVGYSRGDKYISQKDNIHNNQLNIAVSLSSNINIMQLQGEISKSEYMLKQAASDIEAYKTNIYYDIKKNYMNVETAQTQIIAAREKIQHAIDSLDAVVDAYLSDAEGIRYLEFQNARKDYNAAKLEYISKLKFYNESLANLQKLIRVYNTDEL